MGVPKYNRLVVTTSKKLPVIPLNENYSLALIDGNCLIYQCINKINLIENLRYLDDDIQTILIASVISVFNKCLKNYNTEKYIIVFDGVPPFTKQVCQKERRNDQMALSSHILPNSYLMKRIEVILKEHVIKTRNDIIICGSKRVGEGEQKIYQYLREHNINGKVIINSVDSDIIILSQIFVFDHPLVDIDVHILTPYLKKTPFLRVNIKKLNQIFMKNLNPFKLLLFCFLAGNDFVPLNPDIKSIDSFLDVFKKNDVNSLDDIYIRESCKRCCTKKCVENYYYIWRWYKHYFTTNLPIDCKIIIKVAPCISCFMSILIENEKKEFDFEPITYTYLQHMNYVCPKIIEHEQKLRTKLILDIKNKFLN